MKKQFQSFAPVFVTVFLDVFGFGLVIPILAPLFFDPTGVVHATYSHTLRSLMFGLMLALYPFAQLFGAPFLGALSDKIGRKKVILLSLLGSFLGYILFGLGIVAHRVSLLFLSRILGGFMGGNIAVAWSSLADVSKNEEEKVKNFSLMGIAYALGLIIGPLAGGKLADAQLSTWFTLATPFWVAAALSCLNILFVAWAFEETLQHFVSKTVDWLTGFRNVMRAYRFPRLRVLFVVIFFLFLGLNIFMQFFQVFLVEKFNFSESQIGDLFGYTGLWIVFAQAGLTRLLAVRMRAETVLKYATFLLGVSFLALLLPERSWILFVVSPFIAIFFGVMQPNATSLLSDLGGKNAQGEVFGIAQSIQSLAQMIPALLGGASLSFHVAIPIFFAAGASFAAWFIFVNYFRYTKL